MYMKTEEDAVKVTCPAINQYFIGLLAFMILLLGITPGFLLEIAERATTTVF